MLATVKLLSAICLASVTKPYVMDPLSSLGTTSEPPSLCRTMAPSTRLDCPPTLAGEESRSLMVVSRCRRAVQSGLKEEKHLHLTLRRFLMKGTMCLNSTDLRNAVTAPLPGLSLYPLITGPFLAII